jgi:hypothetical protein
MNHRRRVSLVKHVHRLSRHQVQLDLARHGILVAATKKECLLFKRPLVAPMNEEVATIFIRPLIRTKLHTVKGPASRRDDPFLNRHGAGRAWNHLGVLVAGHIVRRCADQHVVKSLIRVPVHREKSM